MTLISFKKCLCFQFFMLITLETNLSNVIIFLVRFLHYRFFHNIFQDGPPPYHNCLELVFIYSNWQHGDEELLYYFTVCIYVIFSRIQFDYEEEKVYQVGYFDSEVLFKNHETMFWCHCSKKLWECNDLHSTDKKHSYIILFLANKHSSCIWFRLLFS